MALSDLTLSQVEQYGGIDLKRNYRKYFGEGLGISVVLHLLVLLLYVGYNWLAEEEETVRGCVLIRASIDFPPPPAIIKDVQPQTQIAPPQPNSQVRPTFGVPVPVPDAVVVKDLIPVRDIPFTIPGDGSESTLVAMNPRPVTITVPVEKAPQILDKTIFVDYSEAPKPVIDIQKLVVYPEFAKRTGIEGTVTVSALIGIDGKVKAVDIEKSTSQWLDDAALEAMRKARFTPALQGDQPVEIWYTQKIQFKLNLNN